jgi:hypothetical protein
MIDIIETVYRGASKGRGLVVAPKGEFGFEPEECGGISTECSGRLFDAVQVLGAQGNPAAGWSVHQWTGDLDAYVMSIIAFVHWICTFSG